MIWKLIALLAVWILFTSKVSLTSVLLGTAISTFILLLMRQGKGPEHSLNFSILGLLGFIPWYSWQLLKSGIKLAVTVCLPWLEVEERFIQAPAAFSTLTQITLFANLITLTPGTISVNFDVKFRLLTVHCLIYTWLSRGNDPENEVRQLEQRLKKVFAQ